MDQASVSATRDPSRGGRGKTSAASRRPIAHAMTDSWTRTLAEWLCTTHAERLPPEVWRAASRATFDTVACALGAVDEPPSQIVHRVVRSLGGTAESSLIH